MRGERGDRPTTVILAATSPPQEYPRVQCTSTNVATNQKKLLVWNQNNYGAPVSHNSIMRKAQLWVAGDFHSTAACPLGSDRTPLESEQGSYSFVTRTAGSQSQVQTRLVLQSAAISQVPYSHPVTHPVLSKGTLSLLLRNNNLLPSNSPLHQQATPMGCLSR